MKAEKPEVIFNLYDWLPSYGENKVKLNLEEDNLSIDVFFDSKEDSPELKRTLYFSNVCYFVYSSIPGVELMNINYSKPKDLGSLLEYKESDAANNWNAHFNFSNHRVRHYQLFFLSQNKRLEVFAQNVIIY
ncbi:MAG TPA: hypothetical protein VIH57_02250 [Bacteroidales bacterium]